MAAVTELNNVVEKPKGKSGKKRAEQAPVEAVAAVETETTQRPQNEPAQQEAVVAEQAPVSANQASATADGEPATAASEATRATNEANDSDTLVATTLRDEEPSGFVANDSPAHAFTPPPAAPAEPQRSGFWAGVMTGVVATIALAAFPVYDGVIKHRQSGGALAQAQHQNLELRVAMAQTDLGLIEGRLAEIAALEAEYRAMQMQKQQLHEDRDRLSERLRNLQQLMVRD